jgi:hypothetical protein
MIIALPATASNNLTAPAKTAAVLIRSRPDFAKNNAPKPAIAAGVVITAAHKKGVITVISISQSLVAKISCLFPDIIEHTYKRQKKTRQQEPGTCIEFLVKPITYKAENGNYPSKFYTQARPLCVGGLVILPLVLLHQHPF